MTVEQQRTRILDWDACLNVRDLGGYPTRHGRETRWGAVVRMGNMGELTDAGRAAALDYGVRTVIDLRKPFELEVHPNPFATPGEHQVRYMNVSLVDASVPRPGFTTLANDYKLTIDQFGSQFAEIMSAIADAPDGTVIVHCMAGKDRTGKTAAFLLDLAGVPRDIIAEDYAMSAECLRPWDQEWLETGPGERWERERDLERFGARAEVITELLEYVDQRYGGVEEYLLQNGVTAPEIERLRERMLG